MATRLHRQKDGLKGMLESTEGWLVEVRYETDDSKQQNTNGAKSLGIAARQLRDSGSRSD